MRKRPLRQGFTLRELFAVVTLICVLLALVMPLIQAARGRQRRFTCHNNLKNIGLSLQNYHDTYKVFPMGAMHAGPNSGRDPSGNAALGPSWWFGIAPFMEQRNVYDRIQATQLSGGPVRHEFCARDMIAAGVAIDRLQPDFMRCYRSPLPWAESRAGPICLPTYVGIAGGCDIDPNSQDYRPDLLAPKTDRVYQNPAKGTGAAAGSIVTSSGMLPPCEHVRLADCRDGTSNTIIVGEQSD